MKVEKAWEDALETAKFDLVMQPNLVFFSTIVLSLRHHFDDTIRTAATNGLNCCYDPKFFMDMDAKERVGLMAHEAMHVAYMHCDPERLGHRNPRLFNVAADHVINLQLLAAGVSLPTPHLADKKFVGMSVEQVYDILYKECPQAQPQMQDLDFDGKLDKPSDGDAQGDGAGTAQARQIAVEAMRQQVQDILIRAVIAAKQSSTPGIIPGDIEIMLDKFLNPKLPWQTILRKWMNSFRKDDYSMRKPNKKYLPQYYIPSLWNEGMGDAAIFCDTSGSVSDSDFSNCVGEAQYLMTALKPKRIFFGQFDTRVKSVDIIKKKDDLLGLKFTGRGGTDVTPVLKWANQNNPKFIIIFSDGYFDIPDIKVRPEVLWLIYNNPSFTAPYGKVIHYESKQ